MRNRWAEEKADLENKVFQMLAVQTQCQGTLRKKEKDYDKLQLQLSKLVKGIVNFLTNYWILSNSTLSIESNKGNKAMITISKPIKANSSQLSATEKIEINAFNLRESEILNIRNNMLALEVRFNLTNFILPKVLIKNYFLCRKKMN